MATFKEIEIGGLFVFFHMRAIMENKVYRKVSARRYRERDKNNGPAYKVESISARVLPQ